MQTSSIGNDSPLNNVFSDTMEFNHDSFGSFRENPDHQVALMNKIMNMGVEFQRRITTIKKYLKISTSSNVEKASNVVEECMEVDQNPSCGSDNHVKHGDKQSMYVDRHVKVCCLLNEKNVDNNSMDVDHDPKIRSFKYHMRPLIIIDASHLKGTYLGTNLLAVGMDGNNQIIPIATGEIPDLSIISDRHATIKSACEAVFPNAFHDAPLEELSDWATAKMTKRLQKSINWIVGGIDKVIGLTDCNHLAKVWFRRAALKATYQGLVYPLGEVSSWQRPNYLQVVKPPLMAKKPAGRPKSTNRIRSQGEEPLPVRCGRCGTRRHNQQSCRETIPQKKAKISATRNSQQAHYYSQQSMSFSFDAVNLDDP
ncbi:hypothetical protein Tco_1560990 [Tanacetum coccineum]